MSTKSNNLRSRIQHLTLENESLRRQYSQRALKEDFAANGASIGWGTIVNPLEALFNGNRLLMPIFPGALDKRTSSSYIYWTDTQRDFINLYCRWLYEFVPTAQAIPNSLCDYVVKAGFTYSVSPKRNRDVSKAALNKAQDIIDEFIEANNWAMLEPENFIRIYRDGELILRLFPQDDGTTLVRAIEPECIRDPHTYDNDPEISFTMGVKSLKSDPVKHLAYWYTQDLAALSGEEVEPQDIIFAKCSDADVKRGLSRYFASQEALWNVHKLVRTTAISEAGRQRLVYIREFAQANQQTVQALQQGNTNYFTPLPTQFGNINQLPTSIQDSSVDDVPEGLTYKQGPQGSGASFAAVVEKAYEQIAAKDRIPTFMISGANGGENYASILAREAPFTRCVERWQAFMANHYKKLMMRVLDIAAQQERISESLLEDIMIQIETPDCAVRNDKEETDRNDLLNAKGLLSRKTWSAREGLDFESEKINISEEPPTPITLPDEIGADSQTPEANYKRDIRRV